MMQHLGDLEEEYDGLQRSKSQTEVELANTRASLIERKSFCHQLQGECEGITDRVSSWAKEQK